METMPKPAKSGQRVWTTAQREEQSRRIRTHKIWQNSTGPRTAQGKAISSQNSYKHGRYTFSRKVLGWYIRLAAIRLKQAKAGWIKHEQNFQNELIALAPQYGKKKPNIMSFYPYFIEHPLHAYFKKLKESQNTDPAPQKSMSAQQAHEFFSGLSEE